MMVFLCVQTMLCQTQLLLQHMIWSKTCFEIKLISNKGMPNTPLSYMSPNLKNHCIVLVEI